jgi:hypothetical protein
MGAIDRGHCKTSGRSRLPATIGCFYRSHGCRHRRLMPNSAQAVHAGRTSSAGIFDVCVAMGTGTDLVSAQVTLVKGDLHGIVVARAVARDRRELCMRWC